MDIELITGQAPGRSRRSVGQRASALVMLSGPYPTPFSTALDRVPFAPITGTGVRQAFYVSMTTEPNRFVSRVVDRTVGGPPTNPAQVRARRRLMLLGNAATVAAGLAIQRMCNHAHWHGPFGDAGRMVGTQLAIGAAAAAVVQVTDAAFGSQDGPPRDLATGTLVLITITQRKALRRLVPRLTLPQSPDRVTIPVRGRWRVRDRELALLR